MIIPYILVFFYLYIPSINKFFSFDKLLYFKLVKPPLKLGLISNTTRVILKVNKYALLASNSCQPMKIQFPTNFSVILSNLNIPLLPPNVNCKPLFSHNTTIGRPCTVALDYALEVYGIPMVHHGIFNKRRGSLSLK